MHVRQGDLLWGRQALTFQNDRHQVLHGEPGLDPLRQLVGRQGLDDQRGEVVPARSARDVDHEGQRNLLVGVQLRAGDVDLDPILAAPQGRQVRIIRVGLLPYAVGVLGELRNPNRHRFRDIPADILDLEFHGHPLARLDLSLDDHRLNEDIGEDRVAREQHDHHGPDNPRHRPVARAHPPTRQIPMETRICSHRSLFVHHDRSKFSMFCSESLPLGRRIVCPVLRRFCGFSSAIQRRHLPSF